MAFKKTLTGWDFCKCPPCEERGNEIYPTTSTDQVLIDELGIDLATWLNIGMDGTNYTSLYSWLEKNYPIPSYPPLPVATYSALGGVIIDNTNLTINDGVLSVNVGSLNIPSVETATFDTGGTVKLGNATALTSEFPEGTISGQVHESYSYNGHVYALPLRLDARGRAGVVVPTDLFTVNASGSQANWTLDWSKKVTNVNIGTPTSGVETNYILLGNKNVNTANGELGYDSKGDLSTSCGYPRLALVAGAGVTLTRYTNTFIRQADNYWGDNITEILISTKPKHPTVGGMITSGLSAHSFRVGTNSSSGSYTDTEDKWIPLIISYSTNAGKCSVNFEIFGREEGKTSYGKYYLNHMTHQTDNLVCLSFYTEDDAIFDYDDIRASKLPIGDDTVFIVVYKKIKNVTDSMFIVNILAENSSTYSTQHYFYTEASSIADTDYRLTNTDLRIGTYNSSTQKMTARLENNPLSIEVVMDTIGAENGTYYSNQK